MIGSGQEGESEGSALSDRRVLSDANNNKAYEVYHRGREEFHRVDWSKGRVREDYRAGYPKARYLGGGVSLQLSLRLYVPLPLLCILNVVALIYIGTLILYVYPPPTT